MQHHHAKPSRLRRRAGVLMSVMGLGLASLVALAPAAHAGNPTFPMAYNPETAAAYPEEYLVDVFKARGLETTRLIPGEWWKHEFAQDILIARKPAPA